MRSLKKILTLDKILCYVSSIMQDYEDEYDYEARSCEEYYDDDYSSCESEDCEESSNDEYEYIDEGEVRGGAYNDEYEYPEDDDIRGGAYNLASDYIGYKGGSKSRGRPMVKRSVGGARRPVVRRRSRSVGGARPRRIVRRVIRPSGSKSRSIRPSCGGARKAPSKNPWIMFLKKHRGKGYNPEQLRRMYGSGRGGGMGGRKPAKKSKSKAKAKKPRKIYDYILPDDPSYQMYV